MSWPMVRLGDVAPAKPIKLKGYSPFDKIWHVTLDQIESNTGYLFEKSIKLLSEAGSSTHAFDDRHVLYSKLRPYLNKVLLPDQTGLGTTELVPMLPDANKLDRIYLAHYLKSKFFVNWISNQTAGAKMPRVTMHTFWNHEIPLPPLPEQKRIAAILDQADEIRRDRELAIAKLDQLAQSIFVEMFGDPVINDKNWQILRLGDVGKLDRGISKHRPRNAPELLGGTYPLVQTGEVANCNGYIRNHKASYSEIGLRQSRIWPTGTLCITIAANIAKTGILTFDACFPDSIVGFCAENVATIQYVRVWLSFLQKTLEDNAPESAQKNINLAILRELPIPFPPIELQEKFASRIKAVEQLKVDNNTALAKHSTLFASLQHSAFTGQL